VGVGQNFTAASKLTCLPSFILRAVLFAVALGLLSLACGVGHDPDPVSLMWRSNVGSSHNRPSRVIPERGKITDDSFKSSMNEHWAVFHEDVTGSYFANHPRHMSPHP
jgi:hypothetical protein